VVFGYSNYWNLWKDQPEAIFESTVMSDTLLTHNLSIHSTKWHWDFGDGATSTSFEPVHIYPLTGNYTVTLSACDSCSCDTTHRDISIVVNGDFSGQARLKVNLTTPDQNGDVHSKNYDADGWIFLFDMTGKLIDETPLISGTAKLPRLRPGVYLWILKEAKIPDQSGKIIIFAG
jgi:PKD repeat protein